MPRLFFSKRTTFYKSFIITVLELLEGFCLFKDTTQKDYLGQIHYLRLTQMSGRIPLKTS